MQHVILVLAMVLLLGIAAKEVTVTKEATANKLHIEKMQEKKVYPLPEEEEDIYKTDFSIGSCYTDLFQ